MSFEDDYKDISIILNTNDSPEADACIVNTRHHPRASRFYSCGLCGHVIPKGQHYSRSVGRSVPDVPRIICLDCAQRLGERHYLSPSGRDKYIINGENQK